MIPPSNDPLKKRGVVVVVRKEPNWKRYLVLVFAAATFLAFSLVWAALDSIETDHPVLFGYVTPQVIESISASGITTIPSIGDLRPAVHVNDAVPVTVSICNLSDVELEATGVGYWERVDVTGFRSAPLNIESIIPVGCADTFFKNPIPQSVVDLVQSEGTPALFRIKGTTTPTSPRGATGSWETQTFWVVP